MCVFSLLLILLVFFTLLSPKAEEEMVTLVDSKHGQGHQRSNLTISNIAVIWPNSREVLFTITEGTGWESGLRVTELSSQYFDRGEAHITLGPGTEYWYIYSASREPVPGDRVQEVKITKGQDTYLLWHPETLPDLGRLSNGLEVITRTDQAALLYNQSAKFPYFEHNMWYVLKDRVGETVRIYSLHDVQQFAEAMPWVAGVAAIMLVSMILWAGSWMISRRGVWAVNLPIIAGALLALPRVLGQFDLPASLLPEGSILDLAYYRKNLQQILTAMDAVGDPSAGRWLAEGGAAAGVVIGLSILLAVALVTAEGLLCRAELKKKQNDTPDGE